MEKAIQNPPFRCLVAGGCGFIGHRVVAELRASGGEIAIIDNRSNYGVYERTRHEQNLRAREPFIAGVRIHESSILDHERLRAVCAEFRPDMVIHLASVPIASVAVQQPLLTAREIVEGTASLLEAARVSGVRRYVYVSSSMTYGDFHHDMIPETHPQQPREPYGALKLAAEHLVRSYTTVHGLPHVIVRPTAVYGPTGNDGFVLTRFARAARNGERIRVLGPETRLDFTFVDDAARGITLASTSPRAINETFNISTGCARSLLDAAQYLRSREPRLEIEVLPPDPLYPRRGALSIEKARRLLAYEPRYTLERGLDELLASL